MREAVPRLIRSVRASWARAGSAALLSVGLLLATGAGSHARAQGAPTTAAPPKVDRKADTQSDSKAAGKPAEKGSVKDNVKQLGRETSDPSTLQRIKAHEQEFEQKVERRRDRQRKDHGTARPTDAVDLAKNLDKPGNPVTPAVTPDARAAGAKKKTEVTPAPPPAKPAMAR
jgi:hypothetical protein